VPPFGLSIKLRMFIDPDVLQFDEVTAAAGTWNDVSPIAPNDLVRASGALVTDLKRGWSPSARSEPSERYPQRHRKRKVEDGMHRVAEYERHPGVENTPQRE